MFKDSVVFTISISDWTCTVERLPLKEVDQQELDMYIVLVISENVTEKNAFKVYTSYPMDCVPSSVDSIIILHIQGGW